MTPAGLGRTPKATMSDAAADPYAYRFSHREILRVLSGVLLCIFLAAIDQTVVIPAVPAIAQDLAGFGHLSWIVSAYLLTTTAATPIYGKLSDIYGRRAMLLPALAIFAAASILCALSQTLWQLIAARALQGLGGAGLMSMAQACIADVVPPRERGRYQGYMAGAWGTASIAGPILGGWVTDALSWRFIFWINLPIAVIAMVLCDRALRLLTVRKVARPRIDYAGAALLTAAVTCWLLVLSWGGTEMPWTAPPILYLLLAGVVLAAILARHERRAPDPLLPPRLFANAVIVRGIVIAFLGSLGVIGGTFLLPLYFQLVGGEDASHSGLLVVPFLFANTAGAYTSGQIARRVGRVRGIIQIGLSLASIGMALMATQGAGSPLWIAVVSQMVVGFGLGLLMPTCLVLVQNAAERRDVGSVTGTILFLRAMGGAFGSTLSGTILTGGFAAGVAGLALPISLNLGDLRSGDAVSVLPDASRRALALVLSHAFHHAFLACAVLLALGLAVAARLRDLPLRTGVTPIASDGGH